MEDLEKLQRMLRRIVAFTKDAEERGGVVDVSVKPFSDLRGVALDAEDVSDEFMYELLRAEAEGGRKLGWATSTDPPAGDAALSDRIARQTAEILSRFDEIFPQQHRPPGKLEVPRRGQSDPSPSSWPVDEEEDYVRGRDDETDILVNNLLSDDDDRAAANDLSMIAIVGPALVGKTTLAKLVYNDPRVAQHFDCRGWVSLTEDPDLMSLLKQVLDSLLSQPCHFSQLEEAQVIVRKQLRNKRFLLVLDDFCDENSNLWSVLEASLHSCSRGSVILVTTPDENVTELSRIEGPLPFYLDGLSDYGCWLIFKYYSYRNGEDDAVEELEMASIREKVVEMCQRFGTPLVAKLLGVSFRNEPGGEAWAGTVERVIEDIGRLPALVRRYRRLPVHLKYCFLYCSLFPRGYLFSKDQLVRLWMAQDLIQATRIIPRRPEGVGIKYFDNLLSRSFFVQSETNRHLFSVPSLMCDMVDSMSRYMHSRVEDVQCLPSEARHLSLLCKSLTQSECFYKYTTLRSLVVMPTFPYTSLVHLEIQDEMFLKLNRLRSLDLSYTDIQTLPDSIGHLKHLRFLALNYTNIKRLPETIHKLYNLQTLQLKHCALLQELPRGIGNLISLRHLDVDSHLVHMPFHIQRLTSLQELPVFDLQKGNGICGISELHDLSELTELGISGLCNVTNLEDAKKANMQSKRYLEILKLTWPSHDSVPNYEQLGDSDRQNSLILEGETGEADEQNVDDYGTVRGSVGEQSSNQHELSSCDAGDKPEGPIGIPDEHDGNFGTIWLCGRIRNMGIQDCVSLDAAVKDEDLLESLYPFNSLKMLYIKSYGGAKFPDWIGDSSFSELTHVELIGCKCIVLPPLGLLPSLKFLIVDGMSVELVGTEFCGTGNANAFLTLETLFFYNMNKWKKWDGVKEGDFPSLNKLCLFNCPLLRRVPDHFSSLEVLEVERCMELTNIPSSPSLQVLKLHCCDGVTTLASLTSLSSLTLMYCQGLKSLPPLPKLDNLWIEDCEQLESIAFCSCCSSWGEQSCRDSPEILLIAHCHRLCLSPVGLLDHIQSSNTGCCRMLSKSNRTHGDSER